MKKRGLVAVCLSAFLSLPVYATNFSYTYVEGQIGRMSLDDGFEFEGEYYDSLGVLGVGVNYQFTDNFALGLFSQAAGNDGRSTEWTEATVDIRAQFPFAVSSALDIVPHVGYRSVEYEGCWDNLCYTVDDSGMSYGVGLRTWLSPDQIEVAVDYTDTDIDGLKSEVTLSGAFWLQQRHRFGLSLAFVSNESQTTTFDYRFHW